MNHAHKRNNSVISPDYHIKGNISRNMKAFIYKEGSYKKDNINYRTFNLMVVLDIIHIVKMCIIYDFNDIYWLLTNF